MLKWDGGGSTTLPSYAQIIDRIDILLEFPYNFWMKNDILQIAALCRHACERYRDEYEDNTRIFSAGLGGMCGMASHFLFNKLEEFCSPRFVMVGRNDEYSCWGHCWVRVGRFHVDITATQFDSKQFLSRATPVFSFRGKNNEHPVLSKFHCAEYPVGCEYFEAKTQEDIRVLLRHWPAPTRYSGNYKSRLDRFFGKG